jgi:phosphoribosylaminoimidazolecarboxamide formyltransferase/IMP cyclohydrolase
VAAASSAAEAFHKAFRADRIAAFGGCVAFNRTVDVETAKLIADQYLEVVVAPEYDGGAVEILTKKKNLRIMRIDRIDSLEKYRDFRFVDFKSLIDGGSLSSSRLSISSGPERISRPLNRNTRALIIK